MQNYKITNLKTKSSIYLNKEEKERFFIKNNYFQDGRYNYKVQNTKDITHKKTENFLFMVVSVCLMAVVYIGLCEILAFIDTITIN
tara:strand:- start:212 stop:469 length:258 start_codon:yes stop_codon:yes gene_type:complete